MTDLKPGRSLRQTLVVLTVAAGVLLASAAASQAATSSSSGCSSKKFDRRNSFTMVCVQISTPGSFTPGVAAKVNLKVTARVALPRLKVTMSDPNTGRPIYSHTYLHVKAGRVLTKSVVVVVSVASASSSRTGGRGGANSVRIYGDAVIPGGRFTCVASVLVNPVASPAV